MQWWCSAGRGLWKWTPTPYPGVWIVVGLVAFVYWRLSRGPTTAPHDRIAGWLGVLSLEVAFDWPLNPLAAGYLASAHALQFVIVALIAPPLILIGARSGIAERWPRSGSLERTLDAALSPLLAAIAFNIIIIGTHVPRVNDMLMTSQLGAFAVDFSWLIAGIWFWWALVVPVPHRPMFAVPLRMMYLFLGTLVHEGIGIVMLMREHPMYGVYELAPRATEMSAITDIKIAGGIMELGAAGVIFGILGVMFFRWAGSSGAERTG